MIGRAAQFQFRCLRCRLSGDSRIRAGVGFSLTFRFVGFALVSEVATIVFSEVATTVFSELQSLLGRTVEYSSKKQGLVHSFMAKIEVAVIEDEGGATHVKQTWTFKYGNRKRDLLSYLEKHHGFGALFGSDGDAIVCHLMTS